MEPKEFIIPVVGIDLNKRSIFVDSGKFTD